MKGPAYRARMAIKREKNKMVSSDSEEGSDEEWVPHKRSKTRKGIYKGLISTKPVFGIYDKAGFSFTPY